MKFCAVKGCDSNEESDAKRKFYLIPRKGQRSHPWIHFTGIPTRKFIEYKNSAYICDRHFLPSDYIHIKSEEILKTSAVPSINGPPTSNVQLSLADNPSLNRLENLTINKSDYIKAENQLQTLSYLDETPVHNSYLDDHDYCVDEGDENSDNVLILTPVIEPPDFIKKKVEEFKKSQLISSNPTGPNLFYNVKKKYAAKRTKKILAEDNIPHPRDESESTDLNFPENSKEESDLAEIIPSKISSGLMVPIDLNPLVANEELTTITHPLDEMSFKESYEEENSQIKDEHNPVLVKSNLPTPCLERLIRSSSLEANCEKEHVEEEVSEIGTNFKKHLWNNSKKKHLHQLEHLGQETENQGSRKNDTDESCAVKFNTYIREEIDKFLDQQNTNDQSVCQTSYNEPEVPDNSVVYLVMDDDFAESHIPDNYCEVACDSPDIVGPTNHKTIIQKIDNSKMSNKDSSKVVSGVKQVPGGNNDLMYFDDNDILCIDLESSLDSPVEKITYLNQSASDRKIYQNLDTSSDSLSMHRSKCVKRKSAIDKSRPVNKKKAKVAVSTNAPSKAGETDRVELKSAGSSDKTKSSAEPTEENDTYLPMPVDRRSPIQRIIDDTISSDENCNEPHIPDNKSSPKLKASTMREHLQRVKELRRKKMMKTYLKPKSLKRRRLPRSKYSIAAYAESLGTFNCRSLDAEPVDLENKEEWHKLYVADAVSASFPRLNEAHMGRMVSQLRARLPGLPPRDQLDVSFLLSLMSAYPGAPAYVKELLTQRLNVLYIATLFQWDTALALAAKGRSESNPTVSSVPLTKSLSRLKGVKDQRPNLRFYRPAWKTDKIVVPKEAINEPPADV